MDNRGLLNKTTGESVIESPTSFYETVFLAVLGMFFSFLFGYFLKLAILESRSEFLLFSFLAAVGFLTFFLLDVFFIKYLWKADLIILLESAGLLAAFYDRLSLIIAVGALISFLFLLGANYSGWQELENTLKIRFWRTSKRVLPKAIIGLALFTSIVYAELVSFEGGKFFISESTFEKIISSVAGERIIQEVLPSGFDLSLTSGEFFRNLAQNQIEQNLQFRFLTKDLKNKLIDEAANNLEKKVSEFLGIPLDPKTKIPEAIYRAMVQKFNQLPENVKTTAPIIMASVIFLIIMALIWPIRWLVTILAFLIYEICLAIGFSTIMMEGTSKEIIILK